MSEFLAQAIALLNQAALTNAAKDATLTYRLVTQAVETLSNIPAPRGASYLGDL